MNSEILKHHHLQLKTITPVSIGADEANTLSPYSDYIFNEDGDEIIYLDNKKVERAVKAANLLDEYVTSIWDKMDNNRSNFDLENFILKDLGLIPDEVAKRYVTNYGLRRDRKQPIQAIIKENGKPYVPGSSIKGALRTAMLYDWLVLTNDGKNKLESNMKSFDAWSRTKSDFIVEKRKPLNKRDRREFNKLRSQINDFESAVFQEDQLFGGFRAENGMDSRRIRVTDSSFAPSSSLGVYATRRIRLKENPRVKGKAEIPVVKEALFFDEFLDFTMTITPPFTNKNLAYWEKDTNEVLKILSLFSKDAVDNELYELEAAFHPDYRREIGDLQEFYTDLLNRIKSGSVFMRLGFGKTRYDNSLALSFYNGLDEEDSENAFMNFRKLMWDVKPSTQVYPVTRTITQEGLPLGWVEITVKE